MLERRQGNRAPAYSNRAKGTRAGSFAAAFAMMSILPIAGLADAQSALQAGCGTDADCKLIYSSCSCVAVPVDDPRTFLPSNVDCAVNRCRAEHIRATCVGQVCEPATKDPPPAAKSGADAAVAGDRKKYR